MFSFGRCAAAAASASAAASAAVAAAAVVITAVAAVRSCCVHCASGARSWLLLILHLVRSAACPNGKTIKRRSFRIESY